MKKKLPLFLLVVVVICAPFFAFAAQDPANLLSGGGGGLVPQCEGAFCRACDLIELANNAINFGIAFSVIVATLMFAYAGILYVTAGGVGAEQVKKAHKVFVNVFVGLIIVLAAWLGVDITFSVLTGQGVAVWSHIDCIQNPVSSAFPNAPAAVPGTPTTGVRGGTPATTALPSNALSQTEALRRLQAAGVCGSPTPCLSGGSLQGIKENTVNQLIQIHKGCGCQFTITSGVRSGARDPHSTGYKVDLRTGNGPLDTFLRGLSAPRYSPGWSPGQTSATVYHDSCGNVYALEQPVRGSSSAPHWDVNVVGGVCGF